MRRTTLILLIALSLSQLGPLLVLPTSQAMTPLINHSWIVSGQTLSYRGTDVSLHSFDVDVVVDSVGLQNVVVDVVAASGEAELVRQATYALSDREDVELSGVHVPFWIKGADVTSGTAVLGRDVTTYVPANPAFYQFSAASRNYYFDKTTGQLVRAENLENGFVLLLIGVAIGPVPTPSATTALSVTAEFDVGGPFAGGSPGDDALDSHPDNIVRLGCRDGVSALTGGVTQSYCHAHWQYLNRDPPHQQEAFPVDRNWIEWSMMATGLVTIHHRDADGDYRVVECLGVTGPVIMQEQIHCRKTLELARDPLFGHQHWMTEAAYTSCLDPDNGFSCWYNVTEDIAGDVDCLENNPAWRCERVE